MTTMVFTDTNQLYDAFLAGERCYDGHVFACMTTTGIFCCFSCPARKPKKENVFFAENIAKCLEQGYRPCKKCRPLEPAGKAEPVIADLMARLEQTPCQNWSEAHLQQIGFDPSTVRRLFKRHIGITFLDYARRRRAGCRLAALSQGASVIHAQLDAGYESASGFREAVSRLLGRPPTAVREAALMQAAWIETPIGALLAAADENALHFLAFSDGKALPGELQRLQKQTGSALSFGRAPLIDTLEKELNAYFSGITAVFHTPLARHGSAFSCKAWEALRQIPPGQTRSYAEQARHIGQPGAMRAIARANSANRIAIIIPCHRVIGADGSPTGYNGGLWRKNWLLNHEKRFF